MMKARKKKAFTLIEIVIGIAMFMIVLLAVFMLNQSSNQSSMDAYYETLAFSLAREPIEVFRGFGYNTVHKIYKGEIISPIYKIGNYESIENDPERTLQYPFEAENFQRRVDLEENTSDGLKYIKITVTVSRKGKSKAENWLSRKDIVLESCIMERPKW